ncbi:hypothetical protein ABEB36_005123 [Hypothenemus hampei]|uniref:endo-polygalacturonase n=1 Tax=Hypothenemus hampei TaxID=57062 RepID=A0ABD1EY34_HYPHA
MKFLLTIFFVTLTIFQTITACTVTQFYQVPVAVEICDNIILDNIEVPGGETLVLHLRPGTTLQFRGNITFNHAVWHGPLVDIKGRNVKIDGSDAILNGQGEKYWDGLGEWGSVKPDFFTIQLHNSTINNIHVLNAPLHGVFLTNSSHVELDSWVIDNSQGNAEVNGLTKAGHNTDGFDIFNSTDIVLTNGVVNNQDDCVALRSGANILVTDFVCQGGHGLSISVGFSNTSVHLNTLKNVTISNSILEGGENGIHIKTHVDAGNGLIQNVTYDNIVFQAPLKYGINIQENYQNLPANSTFPSEPRNNIPIKDLHLVNIIGNVGPQAVPIYILCADEGCYDWSFEQVSVIGVTNNSCNYEPANFKC